MPTSLISVLDGQTIVRKKAVRRRSEGISVEGALGRVRAEDVAARGDVPPFASSAMDGDAVRAGPAGRSLTVVAESRAGAPTEQQLADGEAIRISTGAAVPPGAQAVIPQEN